MSAQRIVRWISGRGILAAMLILALALAWLSTHAQAADDADARGAGGASSAAQLSAGKAAFDYHCAPCHGRELVANHQMLPGTASLALKYKGAVPPALEDRSDLTAAFVKYTVRHGTEVMPFFRKTMVSDTELDAIAAYLSRPHHAAASR